MWIFYVCQFTENNRVVKCSNCLLIRLFLVNGPSDVSVQVTGTVRINCTVLWDPAFELEVNWKKDNVDLHPDGIKVTIDPIDKFLTIRDITFGDEGKKSKTQNQQMLF